MAKTNIVYLVKQAISLGLHVVQPCENLEDFLDAAFYTMTCLAKLRHPSGIALDDGDGLAALADEAADDAARRRGRVGVLGEVVGADDGVVVVLAVLPAVLGVVARLAHLQVQDGVGLSGAMDSKLRMVHKVPGDKINCS